jgi:hypothetical protein
MAVRVLCCGHGEPILDNASQEMREAFGSVPDW